MGIIAWIMIGLVAGFLAHTFLGGRGGIFGYIAVGLMEPSSAPFSLPNYISSSSLASVAA